MKPEFELKNDVTRRIVYVRMSGLYDEAATQAWANVSREGHGRVRQ